MSLIILRLQRIDMTLLFSQTKYCTIFGTSNNSSISDRGSKGTTGYEGWLEKTCQQFSLQRRKKEWHKALGVQLSVGKVLQRQKYRICKDKNIGFARTFVALSLRGAAKRHIPLYGYCWCNVKN